MHPETLKRRLAQAAAKKATPQKAAAAPVVTEDVKVAKPKRKPARKKSAPASK